MPSTDRPKAGARKLSWWSLPAALLTAVFLLFSGLVAPATAAPATADVQGYVFDHDDNSVSGVTVEFLAQDPVAAPSQTPLAQTESDEDGYFEATIPADDEEFTSIWVRYSKAGFETALAGPSSILGGEQNYLSDVYLAPDVSTYGTLSGLLTTKAGKPLASERGYVRVFELGGGDDEFHDFQYGTTRNGDDGLWSMKVPPGQYKIQVEDDWGILRDAWAGTAGQTYTTATTFTVGAQQSVPVPQVSLSEGSTITGKVTDAAGQPIKGIEVVIYESEFVDQGWTRTNSRGEYKFGNLNAGSYRLRFDDYLGEYTGKWYADGVSYTTATDVTLAADQTRTGVNVSLATTGEAPPAYNVSGKVVDKTGVGQRTADVQAYRKVGFEWDQADSTSVRADGSFGFTDLAPGEYKFRVRGEWSDDDDLSFETQWFGGAFSLTSAKVFTVGATGSLALGTLQVARYGAISATASLPSLAGYPSSSTRLEVFDLDGQQVDSTSPNLDGKLFVRVPAGEYYLRFSGERYSQETESAAYYVPQWWKGAYSMGAATKVTVKDGQVVAGLQVSLERNLKAVVAPVISGTATTGKTLKVSSGTWSRQADTSYSYEWKVGGQVAGTGTSYLVKAADRGKAITVTVTASSKYDEYGTGTATTKAVTAKEVSKLALTAKSGKGTAAVSLKLTLPGTAASATSGSVKVYDGKLLVKTVTVKKGSARVTLKLKKGKHALKAVYAGSTPYTSATATKSVTVK